MKFRLGYRATYAILLLLLIPLMVRVPEAVAQAGTVTIMPGAYFRSSALVGMIGFDHNTTATGVSVSSDLMMFNNLNTGNGSAFSTGLVCTVNSNVTVEYIDEDVLRYVQNASAGLTSTVAIYTGSRDKPATVVGTAGALTWAYNDALRILAVQVVHASPSTITITWTDPVSNYQTIIFRNMWPSMATGLSMVAVVLVAVVLFSAFRNGGDINTLFYILITVFAVGVASVVIIASIASLQP